MTDKQMLEVYQHGSGMFARFGKRLNPMSIAENVFAPTRGVKMLSSGLNRMRGKSQKYTSFEHNNDAKRSADAYRSPDERRERGYVRYLSNDEIAVYKYGGKTHVAVRGTANKDDAKTDVLLASGNLKKTDRFKRNKEHLEKIKQEMGTIHSLTGHSLGGALAQTLGDHHKEANITVFNPGAGATGMYGKRKSTVYASHGDPVSALGMLTRKHDIRIVENKGSDSIVDRHAMSNFLQPGYQHGSGIPADMLSYLSN